MSAGAAGSYAGQTFAQVYLFCRLVKFYVLSYASLSSNSKLTSCLGRKTNIGVWFAEPLFCKNRKRIRAVGHARMTNAKD